MTVTTEPDTQTDQSTAPEIEPEVPPEAGVDLPVAVSPLDVPVIPAETEMRTIAQLANTLAAASACPNALRQRPNDCFLVLLTARDLGVSLTTAFREFHVIEGKVTLSPKVKLAMVRQSGLGKVWPDPGNNTEQATWHATRGDQPGMEFSQTFTMEDARRVPAWENKRKITLAEKSTYQAYPARMLSWRAVGYLLDDVFSEVATGLYDADALGAVTDEDGVPIEVTAVESLPGMRGGARPGADPPVDMIAEDQVAGLAPRIERVREHPEAKQDLVVWWRAREAPPLRELPASFVPVLVAKLAQVEGRYGLAHGPEGVEGGAVPPGTPAGPPAPVEGLLPADTGPVDGDVGDWIIGWVSGLDRAEIFDLCDEAGVPRPKGNTQAVRKAWAVEVFDRCARGFVAACLPYGVDAF